MTMAPERSKPLHNFSLPFNLKWGHQKFLKCMKIASQSQSSSPPNPGGSSPPDPNPQIRPATTRPKTTSPSSNPTLKIKDKPEVDNRVALDLPVATDGTLVSVHDESAAARPWNLRTRRAACTEPPQPPPVAAREEKKRNESPPPSKKRERPKFSVALSREEIVGDFEAMVGKRPPRRPKKRAKLVQRQLDALFPGFWLTEVTLDSYFVPELPESGKV